MSEDNQIAALRRRLRGLVPGAPPAGPVLAAVLVPFVPGAQGWSLVFTRRTDHLPSHRGEISFPGGRVEPGEEPLDAALRESHEEIGVDPATVDVLGPLPTVFTRVSNYLISPWAAAIPAAGLRPNPAEIAQVITVPLRVLEDPATRRDQRFIRAGRIFVSPAYDVGPDTIWGATARILTDLLDLLR